MEPKVVKLISIGISALGAAVSFGASIWEDKKIDINLDAKVAEKVAEALKNINK